MSIKTTTSLLFGAALIASFSATVVRAQDFQVSPVFDMGALTASLSVDHVTQSERERARIQGGIPAGQAAGRQAQQSAIAVRSATSNATLRFNPSLARRRDNYNDFIEKVRPGNRAAATRLANFLASNDIIATITPRLAEYGLRTDDVIDAYTLYWLTAWKAAHNDQNEIDEMTVTAVKRQVAAGLGSFPDLVSASDAERQQLTETLFLKTMVLGEAATMYKDNPAMMQQVGVAARRGASSYGFDLDARTLTANGFVSSSR